MPQQNKAVEPTLHWVQELAGEVEARVIAARGENPGRIVCASGISPSGPVHLGNSREILTTHFVVEELRAKGHEAEHLHFWDDYDRFRKVPSGVPAEWQEHLGKPLCDVPDPFGELDSYGEHFMESFATCIAELGVKPTYVRQSVAYRRGDYNELCKIAMGKRHECFDVLADYQTHELHEESIEARRERYFPYRVYCQACGRDETRILGYDDATAVISYTCRCGHEGSFSLDDASFGKLAWKIDWPMRWKHSGVDFEPGGEDHSGPGSSVDVGRRVIRDIFDGTAPHYAAYAFVGMSGKSKLSSSGGATATPRAALDIFEPGVLRWLYLRRRPSQGFSIDFGKEMLRIYDEWDRLCARVDDGTAEDNDRKTVERCRSTSAGPIAATRMPISFRVLASAADIAQGNEDVMLRIVTDHLTDPPPADQLVAQIEPRRTCASRWATMYMPEDERTIIREEFSAGTWNEIAGEQKAGIHLLLEKLPGYWSLDGLTTILYGVPKLQAGLPLDVKPTKELKLSQRAFFVALYRLLCSSETGPRLPTLFLALGQDRVRSLLEPPGE